MVVGFQVEDKSQLYSEEMMNADMKVWFYSLLPVIFEIAEVCHAQRLIIISGGF